jgi:hypothetical protein
MPASIRVPTLIALMVTLVPIGACVTERVPAPGATRFGTLPASATNAVMIPGAALSGAPSALAGARSTLGLSPAGEVPYDGLALPLISPDGRSLATSAATPPSWESLLALPGAEPPTSSRIELFELSQASPKSLATPSALEGLILGRSASDQGFLIEAPQPSGERWVGQVEWGTGTLRWLVQDHAINFGAIELRDGTLCWARRGFDDLDSQLVIRAPGKEPVTLREDGRSLLLPVATPDQRRLGVISASSTRTELVIIDLSNAPIITGRIALADAGSPALAYQILAGSRATPPATGNSLLDSMLVLIDPRVGRAKLVDAAGAKLVPISNDAISAELSAAGLLVTTRDALVWHSVSADDRNNLSVSKVLTLAGTPMLARASSNPGQFVLIGPSSKPTMLQILRLGLNAPTSTPAVR